MRVACFLLLVLIGLPGAAPLRAQSWAQPFFETIDGTEQLGNGIITVVAQDARGFIWAGTTEGLLRYDGYRLRRFHHQAHDPGSLGDDYVRDLQALPDGRLWVATQSGGLSLFDPGSERFTHFRHDPALPQSLPDDGPIELALDLDGVLWLGFGGRGLASLDPATQAFTHYPVDAAGVAGPLHATVRSLLVDRAGTLWLGSGSGLQRRRRGADAFEPVVSSAEAPQGLRGQYVYALFEASDGTLWIGTQGRGAARLDPHRGALDWLPLGEDGLGHPWVDGFVEPREGELWVATFGGGIEVFSADGSAARQHIRHDPAVPGSLALDRVVAPLRDRSGLLWIGTWGGGLQRHNPANADAVRTLRHQRVGAGGLSLPSAHCLLELPDGRLWIGTAGHGIDVFDPARGVVGGYRPDAGRPGALADGTVRALLAAPDGRHWVGTQQAGLFRYRPHSDDFALVETGLPDRRVRVLAAFGEGGVAVGTQRGLALLDAAGQPLPVPPREHGGALDDAVWSVLADAAGDLWVGTPGRLLRAAAGSGVLRAEPGPAGGVPEGVLDLRRDRAGRVHALALNGLFQRRDDGGWRRLPVQLDSPTASLGRQLLIDAEDGLWTPRYRIDPAHGSALALGRADGVDIGNVDMGGALRLGNGQLAFAGTRGVLLLDPARFRRWPFAPPVQPTALEIDGAPQPLADLRPELLLRPGQRRFSVEFAALDFSAPEAIRYAHRLQGLDHEWQQGDAVRRIATYTNLWPGAYRLQVRGSNRNGEWSPDELILDVRVLPLWWQTPWAALALLAAAALAVALAWRWRNRRMLAQAVRLLALVDERTRELSLARDRAEESVRQLTETRDQLVAAEKMAALGQLVAGVAHEINTPLGIALTAASHLRDVSHQLGEAIDSGRIGRRALDGWRSALDEGSGMVLGSLERASGLVATFKRVAVERGAEARSRFALAELGNELQAALEPACRRAGHPLRVILESDAVLDSYHGAAYQVLASLVGNALQHAFDEGQRGQITIRLAAEGDAARIVVSDDGRGMSDAVAARAFEPFFTTRRGAGGSTGLGLHIVHNLVTQLLGGYIRLHTAEGEGCRVEVLLPLRAADRGD